jgi:ubiquitin C-terminal hydrolase
MSIGLTNSGVDCYINSILQCMFSMTNVIFHVNKLAASPLATSFALMFNRDGDLRVHHNEFIRLVHDYWKVNEHDFDLTQQQDANECFVQILSVFNGGQLRMDPINCDEESFVNKYFKCTFDQVNQCRSGCRVYRYILFLLIYF